MKKVLLTISNIFTAICLIFAIAMFASGNDYISAGLLMLFIAILFFIPQIATIMNRNKEKIPVEKSNKNIDSNNNLNNDILMETYTKIVGVTFKSKTGKDRQRLIKKLRPKQILKCKPYLYDMKPAYMLLNQNGDDVGNISAELAKSIDKIIKNNAGNADIIVQVSEITGGTGKKDYGCNILLKIKKKEIFEQENTELNTIHQ